MPFTENLAQFFDTDDFATQVTLKTGAGVTIRTANVILTDSNGHALLFDDQVLAAVPFFQCRTVDLTGVDNTCKVTIGAQTYNVVDHIDDGTGTSMVQIRK